MIPEKFWRYAGIVAAGAAAVGLIAWGLWPSTPEPGSSVLIQPAKEEVKAGPKEELVPKRPIRKVPDKVKKPLGLPQTVQDDQQQHVLATAQLKAESRPYTITSVLNEANGDTSIYARPDPLPWIGLESAGAVGVYAGIRSDGKQVIRVSARHDLVRIKAIHVGVAGTVDSDGQWFAGVGAEFRY